MLCCDVFRFAHLTAAIFLRCEIPVYLFSKIIPTPFVVSNLKIVSVLLALLKYWLVVNVTVSLFCMSYIRLLHFRLANNYRLHV